MHTLLTALVAYLVGSIPFGLLLTRAAGLGDIRSIGSGNIGATNVLRTGRRGLAAATLLLDALKGFAAGLLLTPHPVAAVAVVIGHCAPVWLGFRGGKGVATGLGVLWGLDWRLGAIACATWLVLAAMSRRSSAGALAAFVVATAAATALDPRGVALATLVVTLLVVARHHANIRRLLDGTEPAIGRRA